MDGMTEQEQTMLKAQQGFEQLGAMLRSVYAPVVAGYFVGLVASGVPEEAAALLTADMQAELLAPVFAALTGS